MTKVGLLSNRNSESSMRFLALARGRRTYWFIKPENFTLRITSRQETAVMTRMSTIPEGNGTTKAVAHHDVMTIVGNRPQFIKMGPVSAELSQRGYRELIVHTGQHFDPNMSEVFFEEFRIPKPAVQLEIAGRRHGEMTAGMLQALERIMLEHQPTWVLNYGDTNSTLAAALAAVKLKILIAHIEAGPRIYDVDTPEEINRIVADHAARLRFCPDMVSVQNLAKENITDGVYFTGD